MAKKSIVGQLCRYLSLLNEQIHQTFSMNPLNMLDEEEREAAARLMSDGGRGAGGPADGSGDEDDESFEEELDDVKGETGVDAGFAETEDGSTFDAGGNEFSLRQKVGLVLGPLVFALILLAPNPDGLSQSAQAVAACTSWVAIWWIAESIPIPATSLLPLVLFPLTGAVEPGQAASPYASTLIFLFMGGFLIAVSLQRWNLHRRIALRTIKAIGTNPSRIILGFMVATAFLSMWISNTATTVMMTPIGLAVVMQVRDLVSERDPSIPVTKGEFRFGTALMLGIAYSATVGGVGTLIGTPPNIVLAGAVEETFGRDISFAKWMLYGVPIATLGVGIVWVYLTKFMQKPRIDSIPGGLGVIEEELEKLGPMKREEKLVLIVFSLTGLAWISRKFIINAYLPMIDDSTIAMLGAMALFLIPAREEDGEVTFLLDWTTALEIPWGVILLFGGGLSIASAFDQTGLAKWIGGQLAALEGVPILIIMGVVVVLTIFMTEITSNTATTAMLMPILASLAVGLGVHPYGLMIGAATAASFAFMLPVATPPNAVVFGSGYLTIPQMAKTGSGLNLIGIVLIILLSLTWLPMAWGINIGTLPAWAIP